MLSYTATNDGGLLTDLSRKIFGEDFDGSVGYVLFDGDRAVGLASLKASPENSVLRKIGVLPECRGQKLGDFFTRALLFNLSMVSEKITTEFVSDYLAGFGFKQIGGKMEIMSADIRFPHDGED